MTELVAKLKAALGQCADESVVEREPLGRQEIKDELYELRLQMERTEMCYNMARDGDIIESLIYQRGALMSRYEYLIKRAKEQSISGSESKIST